MAARKSDRLGDRPNPGRTVSAPDNKTRTAGAVLQIRT